MFVYERHSAASLARQYLAGGGVQESIYLTPHWPHHVIRYHLRYHPTTFPTSVCTWYAHRHLVPQQHVVDTGGLLYILS